MRTLPRYMPALVTPFTRTGDLDADGNRANTARLAGDGVTGFLVAGSTGEGPYLEPGERGVLCASARDGAPRSFVLCGVAAESVRQALAQIGEAAEGGADAVLVVTPTSLIRGRDDLVAGFYGAIADASPLPLLMYTFTRVTGWELPAPLAATLAGHPTIVGMKDSNGNPERTAAVMSAAPDGFAIFAGASRAVALTIAAGGYGAITASGNYAWSLNADVIRAARRSVRSAASPQAAVTALAGAVERHGLPATKHAAGLVGLATGRVRQPLTPPGARVRREVATVLAGAGLVR